MCSNVNESVLTQTKTKMISLRDVQQTSVDELMELFKHQSGGSALTSPMGSGKTVVVCSFVKSALEDGPDDGVALIIVPLSTIVAWEREWCRIGGDPDCVTVYHGAKRMIDWEIDRQVILTTIGILRSDRKRRRYTVFNHQYVIMAIDEAHTMANLAAPKNRKRKGATTETAKSKKKTKAPCYKNVFDNLEYDFGLPITGTPFVNRTRDLRSLLSMMNNEEESVSGNDKSVTTKFNELVVHTPIAALASSMPTLTYEDATIPFGSDTTKGVAITLANEVRSLAMRIASMRGQGMPVSEPLLLKFYKMRSEARLHSNMGVKTAAKTAALTIDVARTTPKCKYLLEALHTVFDDNDDEKKEPIHGIAIVSRYTSVLETVLRVIDDDDDLPEAVFYHGGLSIDDRNEVLDSYMATNNDVKIIALSMDAAAVGLNLRGQHMFLLDQGDNHSVEAQVSARFRRLGQTGIVHIVRMMMEVGIDVDMKDAKISKLMLARTVDKDATASLRDVYHLTDEQLVERETNTTARSKSRCDKRRIRAERKAAKAVKAAKAAKAAKAKTEAAIVAVPAVVPAVVPPIAIPSSTLIGPPGVVAPVAKIGETVVGPE
jgi:SNF2 family DNA or RNA helicase